MNAKVEAFIGRADRWSDEMTELRTVLLSCGLDESIKWGKPCFARDSANIAIFQPMKDFLALMFFKGALLEDPQGELREQGPNSRSAKRMEFTSLADVTRLASTVTSFVEEAIDAEEAGLEIEAAPALELVAELQERLDDDPDLRAAFDGLTPGRQREYHLHVSDAKQESTRRSRVEKVVPKIMAGKGFRDR